jgi:hypothetical protein
VLVRALMIPMGGDQNTDVGHAGIQGLRANAVRW